MSFLAGMAKAYQEEDAQRKKKELLLGEAIKKRKDSWDSLSPKISKRKQELSVLKKQAEYLLSRGVDESFVDALVSSPDELSDVYQVLTGQKTDKRYEGAAEWDSTKLNEIFSVSGLDVNEEGVSALDKLNETMSWWGSVDEDDYPDVLTKLGSDIDLGTSGVPQYNWPEAPDSSETQGGMNATWARTSSRLEEAYQNALLVEARRYVNAAGGNQDEDAFVATGNVRMAIDNEDYSTLANLFGPAAQERVRATYQDVVTNEEFFTTTFRQYGEVGSYPELPKSRDQAVVDKVYYDPSVDRNVIVRLEGGKKVVKYFNG